MGKITDEYGIEVEESVFQKTQDPKFQELDAVLSYREARKQKKFEIEEGERKKTEEKEKPKGIFEIFS